MQAHQTTIQRDFGQIAEAASIPGDPDRNRSDLPNKNCQRLCRVNRVEPVPLLRVVTTREQMAADVKRHRDRTVPEPFLHDFRRRRHSDLFLPFRSTTGVQSHRRTERGRLRTTAGAQARSRSRFWRTMSAHSSAKRTRASPSPSRTRPSKRRWPIGPPTVLEIRPARRTVYGLEDPEALFASFRPYIDTGEASWLVSRTRWTRTR